MIIGAQKSGTTSLATQLGKHPGVCFCLEKEPHFFSRDSSYNEGLESYHSLFKPSMGQILGEASTSYTFFPEYQGTVERLYAYNPGLKFIYIMRQPVDRIVSQYSHGLLRGLVDRPLDVEVLEDSTYVNRSRYGMQIGQYLEYFALENIAFVLFEDFVRDQRGVLMEIAAFLDIAPDYYSEIEDESKNRTVGVSQRIAKPLLPLAPLLPGSIRRVVRSILFKTVDHRPVFTHELRRELWSLLEDDVKVLEGLMGRSLGVWGDI